MASQELQDKAQQAETRGGIFMATLVQLTALIDAEGSAQEKVDWHEAMNGYIPAHQALREVGEKYLPGIFPAGGSS